MPKLLTLSVLTDKIIEFCEELAGMKLYTYQIVHARRLIYSVLENEGAIVTELISRQAGKTTELSIVAEGLCIILPELAKLMPDDHRLRPFINGFWMGIYAPKQDQALISYDKMRMMLLCDRGQMILNDPTINVRFMVNRGDSFVFDNGSKSFAKSASPDSKIEGQTLHLCLLDECQGLIASKIEKEIVPQLVNTCGTIAAIGTVGYSKDWFFKTINRNKASQQGRKIRDHYQYDYSLVIQEKRKAFDATGEKIHLNYERKLTKDIARMGGIEKARNNREFRMNYMLVWDDSISNFITEETLHSIQMPSKTLVGLHPDYMQDLVPTQCAGLDVAKKKDKTVLTVIKFDINCPEFLSIDDEEDNEQAIKTSGFGRYYYAKLVIGIYEIRGKWENQIDQALDIIRYKHNIEALAVDATGVGDPIHERLEDLLPEVEVYPFIHGTIANDFLYKDYYQELTAGRHKVASSAISQAKMEWDFYMEQHEEAETKAHGNEDKFITIMSPEEGKSLDYVVSSALANWCVKKHIAESPPLIEATSNTFYKQATRMITPADLGQGWPHNTATAKAFPNRLIPGMNRTSYRDRRERRVLRHYD